MNKLQQAQFNAYKLTLEHLEANLALVKTIPVFEMIINSARALLDAIQHADNKLLVNSGGETAQKELDTHNLASMAFRFSSVLFAYASMKKDMELLRRNDFSLSKLKSAPDKLKGISENILADARVLAAELDQYGITAMLTDSFDRMIEDFDDVVQAPRRATALKSKDTKQVAELLSEARRVFKQHVRPMMVNFRDSHPDFYNEYKRLRVVVDPYTRHTRISALITDKNGNPVSGAVVVIEGTAFTGTTDAEGKMTMRVPVIGKAVIRISKDGYETVSVEKSFIKGRAILLAASI